MASEFSSVQWDSGESATASASRLESGNGGGGGGDGSHGHGDSRRVTSPIVTATTPSTSDPLVQQPSLLQELSCTVSSPQKEAEGTKDVYISYLIITETTLPTFQARNSRVRRRFTDFLHLHDSLLKDFPAVAVPPLPAKHKMEYIKGDRFSPEFTARRCASLNRFLFRISLHPLLRKTSIVCTFLESGDWNAVAKKSPGGASSGRTGSSRNADQSAGVFDGFQDTLLNAFSKLSKPDRRFIDIRDRANKIDQDLSHVEKLLTKVVRKQSELVGDYADFEVQITKLSALEPELTEPIAAFGAALNATSEEALVLRDSADAGYLTSLNDMSAYTMSLKALLKARDQRQLDAEALSDYLDKTVNERSATMNGSAQSTTTNFLNRKVEDLRGVDHEQARRDRLRKLELKADELKRESERAGHESKAFDDAVLREAEEFERIKTAEQKKSFGDFATANMEFYKAMIKTWEAAIPEIQRGASNVDM